jgi:hypothetical protein
MPRQKRSRHLPLSRRNVPDEQERSQRHSYVEKDVLGVLNRQTATCAASCTAAETSPGTAAERFRWPRHKDPAMALSPTVNLLELCKKALTKWKEQKARCPERSHPGVSRARKAAARNVPAHHNDNGDAHTFSVLPESGQTPEELAILAALNAEDEDAPQLDLPDAETNFALVGPYKPAAGF